MNYSLIVAMADNGVIGKNNQLPWHLPSDLGHFKRITLGKPVIMGRKTFESIGKPLVDRDNIVISRDVNISFDGAFLVSSIDAAKQLAFRLARDRAVNEVLVIGGATVYKQMLGDCSCLYVTRVHTNVSGDAFFPKTDWAKWQEVNRIDCDDGSLYPYSFIKYQKI